MNFNGINAAMGLLWYMRATESITEETEWLNVAFAVLQRGQICFLSGLQLN